MCVIKTAPYAVDLQVMIALTVQVICPYYCQAVPVRMCAELGSSCIWMCAWCSALMDTMGLKRTIHALRPVLLGTLLRLICACSAIALV